MINYYLYLIVVVAVLLQMVSSDVIDGKQQIRIRRRRRRNEEDSTIWPPVSRPLLNFNVSLMGRNAQLDDDIIQTLQTVMEEVLYEGLSSSDVFLNDDENLGTIIIDNIQLQQYLRSELFPGSLIKIFGFMGHVSFVRYIPSITTTRNVQMAQVELLTNKNHNNNNNITSVIANVQERLRSQYVFFPVDSIQVPLPPNQNGTTTNKDNDKSSSTSSSIGDSNISAGAWAIIWTISILAFLILIRCFHQKTKEIKQKQQQQQQLQTTTTDDTSFSSSSNPRTHQRRNKKNKKQQQQQHSTNFSTHV
eukprot:scaffold363_cov56-Cylindrotheca_fusiformis.AAC.21